MPDTNASGAVSNRPLPDLGTPPTLPVDAVPMPMPIAVGEPTPGGRVRFVVGSEGDDTLTIEGGATAIGGGGNDTFVLVSNGLHDGIERLGAILDYNEGDKLDLGKLGDKAAIVGREAFEGGETLSIDYDGDGVVDGVLETFTGKGPATVEPSPGDGEFHILPYPLPGEAVILPVDFDGGIGDGAGEGVFTILPYPMPGDGEAVIFRIASDWAI